MGSKPEIFTISPCQGASSDSSGLARLATLVPRVKMTSDQAENNRRNRIRSSMVNIVDWVCRNPELCPDLWLSLNDGHVIASSGSAADGEKGRGNGNPWDKPTFGKVSPDDIARWMCSLTGGPSKELIDLVDCQDGAAVRDIFTALLQLRPSDRIPADARKDLRIATKMLMARMEAVGPRLPGWFQKSVSGNGQVDFTKVPIFTPIFHQGRVAQLRHINGDVADVPAHITITADYRLVNPHDDMGAKMVKAPDERLLANFYAAGKGPRKHAIDKKRGLQPLIDRAKKEIEEEDSKVATPTKKGATDGAVLKRRLQEKRNAALERARAALESNPKRSRTVQFTV